VDFGALCDPLLKLEGQPCTVYSGQGTRSCDTVDFTRFPPGT